MDLVKEEGRTKKEEILYLPQTSLRTKHIFEMNGLELAGHLDRHQDKLQQTNPPFFLLPSFLTLALFVLRIDTNHHNAAFTANHVTLFTHSFY
jgi:hypothetical protein